MNFIVYNLNFGHEKGEFCMKRTSDVYFISYFLTDYVYEKGGRLLEGNAGDAMIITPGNMVYHGPSQNAIKGFVNDWMYLEGDDFAELLEKYPLPLNTPFNVSENRILARCIEKINLEQSYMLSGYAEKCDMYMREAIIDLYRSFRNQGYGDSAGVRLERLRSEITKDPKKNWTLSKMAEFCGYSESHFSTLYKKNYVTSPISDLIKIKMEHAKLLLKYSSLSVSDVAEAVGYSSIYYFSKYFKNHFNVSPTEYKKSAE
jgi:AraC family transcriptional regulator of arabinose operon